jgi:photosystem II stability/assembly factor-like uncharacterized protein
VHRRGSTRRPLWTADAGYHERTIEKQLISTGGMRRLFGTTRTAAVLVVGLLVTGVLLVSPPSAATPPAKVAAAAPGTDKTPSEPPAALEAVACPTTATCIAVGGAGGISVSHDRGWKWSTVTSPTKHYLFGVSCPTPAHCVAVGDAGTALVTTDGGRIWKQHKTGVDLPLSGVDCPGTRYCVAVGDGDAVLLSNDGGVRWRRANRGLGVLDGVGCSSSLRCVGVTSAATLDLSTDDGTKWTITSVPFPVLDGLQAMNGVSCHLRLCVAVGARGLLAVSSDSGGRWSATQPVTSADIEGTSCPSALVCVVVGTAGTVLRTIDAGLSWTAGAAPTGQTLLGVDCPSTDDCVAVGSGGTVLTSSDGGVLWSVRRGRPVPSAAVRVLVVGDSFAHTLAMGLARNASAYGVTLFDGSLDGCALARGSPVLLGPAPYPVSGPCAPTGPGWPAQYQADVATDSPDLSLLVLGPWDLSTRSIDGTWQTPGQTGFDTYYFGQLLTAVAILSADGGRVAITTLPDVRTSGAELCVPPPSSSPGCPTEEERVAALNAVAQAVANGSSGRVTLIDLHGKLDPRGTFQSTVDGVVVRAADGVHLSEAGGQWLTPWLLPKLIAASH